MASRFEDLLEQYHDEIFSYVWRLLGRQRWSDAAASPEDLAQEVFLRAYRAFPVLRENSNHRAWLYKIATNLALTQLRRFKYRRSAADVFVGSAQCSAHSTEFDRHTKRRLASSIDALPDKQRACVTLRYLQDLDYAEIARALGCSEESARANVSQALRKLRRALEEQR